MGIIAELWDYGLAWKVAFVLVVFITKDHSSSPDGPSQVIVYNVYRSVYLLHFHPLAHFPGPRFAAVSELSHVYNWLTGRYHNHIDRLHRSHGSVVRIAPNELSFNSAQSLQDIYGYPSKNGHVFLKSAFYAGPSGYSTIVMERDPVRHRETRKLMAYGFSSKELQAQEPTLTRNLDLFIHQIETQGGLGKEGISLNRLIQAFVFDTIGELALGESFGALSTGRSHPWIETIHGAIYSMSIVQIAPRLPVLWLAIPFVVPWSSIRQFVRFFKFQTAMTRRRLDRSSNDGKRDLFSFLLKEKPDNFSQIASEKWLGNQAGVLIAAGFDTSAVTAVAVSYYLARSPEHLRRLREEVHSQFAKASEIKGTMVHQLPYLAACLEETMRIMPSITFGLPRESPGAQVDGHFVPKGTVVSTNGWSITRRPDYFFEPEVFHPERWLPSTHKYYNPLFSNDLKEASQPFSLGSRACLGINLAYVELKLLLARLAWEYEWEIVNASDFNWEADCKFQALWVLPQVRLRYSRAY